MFTDDDLFWSSLWRTFYFAGLGVPLGVLGSLYLAILLNSKLKGVTFYRTLFFMPSLVPLVAAVILWKWLLNSDFGLVNQWLRWLGVTHPPGWFADSQWADSIVDHHAAVEQHWRHTDDHFSGRFARRPAGTL